MKPYVQAEELPIQMSGPMSRAILDGDKTETRRTRGLTKVNEFLTLPKVTELVQDHLNFVENYADFTGFTDGRGYTGFKHVRFPFGGRRTRLWVKETYYPAFKRTKSSPGCVYRADQISPCLDLRPDWEPGGKGWKPSMFMPKWVTRTWLQVLDWDCQRLHQIDEQGAAAEGIISIGRSLTRHGRLDGYGPPGTLPEDACRSRVEAYRRLWERLNGKGSWDLNPFVWVIKFKRVG